MSAFALYFELHAPANMLLLAPIIQMSLANGQKDVDLHQVSVEPSRLGERQKGRELRCRSFLVSLYLALRVDIGNQH